MLVLKYGEKLLGVQEEQLPAHNTTSGTPERKGVVYPFLLFLEIFFVISVAIDYYRVHS